MSWESGTATDYLDLLNKLNTFLLKGHTLPPVYTGTGNGLITNLIGSSTSVQETITVTFTSATAFGVVGSVTGSMGTGTVGTAFSHARVGFTITAGGTAWVSGDTISFVMTPAWTQMRGVSSSEYIWRAPGNANADQIFVGAKVFSDAGADYYNWRLGGFTGYASGSAFTAQPGACVNPVLPLINQGIPYWFVADGRRVMIIASVSTVWETAYLGLLDPYASAGQWPYPLVVGGGQGWASEPASNSTNWRWSYSGTEHNAFWRSDGPNTSYLPTSLMLRRPDGSWRGFWSSFDANHGAIWPWTGSMLNLRANLDGTYPLLPIVLSDDSGGATNVFGEFNGILATTGFNNVSGNYHTVGRDTWLVVQNTSKTSINQYAAFRLS